MSGKSLRFHWAVTDTWFKRNNMSPIVADRPRYAFPLKSFFVGVVVMVGKIEWSSTLPIIEIVCRRLPQTTFYVFPYVRDMTQTGYLSRSQTVADRYRSNGNQIGTSYLLVLWLTGINRNLEKRELILIACGRLV